MPTEIIVMATMAAALLLVTAVWADLYTFETTAQRAGSREASEQRSPR